MLIICLSLSCSDKRIQEFDKQELKVNKFINSELQKIIDYQNQRNTIALLGYFEHPEILYRETAVLAMASVQDTIALINLFEVLKNEKSIRLRMAAAFSIGQTGSRKAEKDLIEAFQNESSEKVKVKILESIGKCGSDTGLIFVTSIIGSSSDSVILNGALLGLARFSLRNIFSMPAIEKIVTILREKQYSEVTKYYASIALVRLKEFDLSTHFKDISACYSNSSDVNLKMNLAVSISKAKTDESLIFLEKIVLSNDDYRIKVNALKGFQNFDFDKTCKIIFKALEDTNINIAIQASETIQLKGSKKYIEDYLSMARKIKNWRVRSNLYSAALNISANKDKVSQIIISEYKTSENIYEKAGLLRALGNDVANYKFVNTQIALKDKNVIKSSGMEALANMVKDSNFVVANEKSIKSGMHNLTEEFAIIFKNAIISGDIAQIAIAAEAVRSSVTDFRKYYKNSYFLTQALNNCHLPQEIDSYRELKKTIAYINGTKETEEIELKSIAPDWKYIIQIPYNQQIKIYTSKGEILLQLDVNLAPLSVSNFLKLVNQKYFNNKLIHRTVPNFVVQDGCPRGDGWGGPDYTICSEFAMNYYSEGSLGMASAGKDTEASQWFITHSPTPHLDGRYTNFGKVISGMETVHLLEVGDTIRNIEVLRNN